MREKDSFFSSNMSLTHNRSKTEKLSKLCPTEIAQSKDSFDPYTSFIYRDHITRNRYEISNLKNRFRATKMRKKGQKEQQKIKKVEDNHQFQYYSEQLNFLKNIRFNRNQHLMSEFVKMRNDKNQSEQQKKNKVDKTQKFIPHSKSHVSKIKKKIQTEVMSLNQEFLREYLYHEQPFDQTLLQINRCSDSKVLNEQKIDKLKKNLLKCIEQRNSREDALNGKRTYNKRIKTENTQKSKWDNFVENYYEKQANKQLITKQMDQEFDNVWNVMSREISSKVRFEGEFNWFKEIKKKKKLEAVVPNSNNFYHHNS